MEAGEGGGPEPTRRRQKQGRVGGPTAKRADDGEACKAAAGAEEARFGPAAVSAGACNAPEASLHNATKTTPELQAHGSNYAETEVKCSLNRTR